MSNPVLNNPVFQDGIAAVVDSLVSNINLGVDHLYAGDSLGEQGTHESHLDPAQQALGSRTQDAGVLKGSVDVQLLNALDSLPRPGDILLVRGAYYKTAGAISPKRTRNKTVPISLPAESVINPLILTCLTSNGQILTDTFASGGGSYTKTFAVAASTVRNGATKTFSIAAWTEEYPTATVPSGMTINSSTGAMTYTTPAAGTYFIKILCQDAVANKNNKTGVGFLILTIT